MDTNGFYSVSPSQEAVDDLKRREDQLLLEKMTSGPVKTIMHSYRCRSTKIQKASRRANGNK